LIIDQQLMEIEELFHAGLKYKDIFTVLACRHGHTVSERHLKRILKAKDLSRRKNLSPLDTAITFISNQLCTSGRLHGYRWMYTKCLLSFIHVTKEEVRLILKYLDDDGVQQRLQRRPQRRAYFSKGPHFIWHVDGYDKLKLYGICISGAIDGFSRYVVWLEANTTNSDPSVIGGYYLNALQRFGGCPSVIHADFGTENVRIRDIQTQLRPAGTSVSGGPPSYIEGTSTTNQKIESWWGYFAT
jgi:hypothetical protein